MKLKKIIQIMYNAGKTEGYIDGWKKATEEAEENVEEKFEDKIKEAYEDGYLDGKEACEGCTDANDLYAEGFQKGKEEGVKEGSAVLLDGVYPPGDPECNYSMAFKEGYEKAATDIRDEYIKWDNEQHWLTTDKSVEQINKDRLYKLISLIKEKQNEQ